MEKSYEISWCIAALPNQVWASNIYNSIDSYNKLAETIYKMCMVDTNDPIKSWNDYIKKSVKLANKLNELEIKKLHYKNALGTDLEIELPADSIWLGVGSEEEKDRIVNMRIVASVVLYIKKNGRQRKWR